MLWEDLFLFIVESYSPVCVCVCVCVCMCVSYNFFVHLSVDGHLGCFHILVILNNAAVNIGVHISF